MLYLLGLLSAGELFLHMGIYFAVAIPSRHSHITDMKVDEGRPHRSSIKSTQTFMVVNVFHNMGIFHITSKMFDLGAFVILRKRPNGVAYSVNGLLKGLKEH